MMDGRAEEMWADHRRRLLNIAYRMLGSRFDAEDVVQEVFVRLSRVTLDEIEDPTGWLITVTGRLCIDRMRTIRSRRETYPGPWLPQPILGEGPLDPADRITLDDSVRMAMLVVLEQLTPPERASFILHDVFQLPFDQVAGVVGRSPEACRQLASRARRRLARSSAPRFEADPDTARAIVEEFSEACQTGDLRRLIDLLDPMVEGLFDSGGHVPGAPAELLVGAQKVAGTLIAAFSRSGVRLKTTLVNGEPGVEVVVGSRLMSVVSVSIRDGRVTHVHGVGNPDKLGGRTDQC